MRNSKTSFIKRLLDNAFTFLILSFYILCTRDISAQTSFCPASDVNCAPCIMDISVSTLPVYASPNDGASFNGNIPKNGCLNCVDNASPAHHCYKFRFILDEPAYPYLQIHIGQGNNCQGNLDAAYDMFNNGKCDELIIIPGSRSIIDFNSKGSFVDYFLCVNSHSQVSLCNVAKSLTPLGVGFTSLFVEQKEYSNEISWSTLFEANNDYFIVERSMDVLNWEDLGKIAGVGNSTTLNSYSFADISPLNFAYYRIKQVDFDGTISYSETIRVNRAQSEKVTLYPNPTNDILYFTLNQPANGLVTVTIKSISGEECLIKTFGPDDKNMIDIKDLPNGSYLINIVGNGLSQVKKFVKIDEYH